MRTKILVVLVVIIVAAVAFALWRNDKTTAPSGPDTQTEDVVEVPPNTEQATVGDITLKHPESWTVGSAGGGSILQFEVEGKPATLALETGLKTATLESVQESLGAAWREVNVAGKTGIEVGLGASEQGNASYLRFEYYSDELALRGERLVVTVTGLSDQEVSQLEAAAYDPYAIISAPHLASMRSVVAEASVN